MTAPNYQAIGTGSETSCAWPTHAAKDWAVLPVQHNGGTVTTPSGCSVLSGSPFSTPEVLSVFLKKAASNAESALSLSGGTDHMWGSILTVRNAHQVYPVHAAGISSRPSGAATTNICPGVKVTIDDTVAVDVFAWNIDDAGPIGSAETNASLTSYAERYDAGTITGNGGGLWMASGSLATPGMIGSSSFTTTSSSGLALKLVFAPIADIPIYGRVFVDAVQVTPGGTGVVRLIDLTQKEATYLVVDVNETDNPSTIFNTTINDVTDDYFYFQVPYNDHEYVAVYMDETGNIFGSSDRFTYSSGFPAQDINIYTSSYGGGLKIPGAGATYVR